MKRWWGAAAGVVAVALAGCTSSAERPRVESVAVAFVTAVEGKDGAGACALLSDNARDAAGGATDTLCAKAVLNVEESGASVGAIQVWDDAAQVHVGSDVVFLRRLGPGWRVDAAGCKPQPPGPYKCDVEG